MAYERSESARDNFSKFIHQLQPETNTLIRKLEMILIKLYRQNVSLLFNQTCLSERILPNYTHTHTHTHTHIYMCVCVYACWTSKAFLIESYASLIIILKFCFGRCLIKSLLTSFYLQRHLYVDNHFPARNQNLIHCINKHILITGN